MKGKQWSVRPYRKGDEDRIRELFKTVFGKELGAERWNWQYRDNPTGVMAITLAESPSGELVGQCALRPVRMKIGERIHIGALALDSMVHPDYQRQGMFTKLATQMYAAVAEQGVPLVYSFPNRNSQYVYKHKLGRIDLCDRIPVFTKILDARAVLGKRIRNRFVLSVATPLIRAAFGLVSGRKRRRSRADYYLEEVSRFDDRIDDLWPRASIPYSILVVRDKVYLNWRYAENPTEDYTIFVARRDQEIVGYVVLKCETRFGLEIGFIVDLLTLPDELDIGNGLVSRAVEYFLSKNSDLVGCLMLERAPLARSLRENGFVLLPDRLFPQELHLSVRRLSEEYTDQFITNPQNWFVTWGDHDVV